MEIEVGLGAGVLVILIIMIFLSYKSLNKKFNKVKMLREQINVHLDERFKLFEFLINDIRKIMDYEQTVLKEVVQLRIQAQSEKLKGNSKSQLLAEEQIGLIAKKINFVFEQYPQLTHAPEITNIQSDFAIKEKELAKVKKDFNTALRVFKESKQTFGGKLVCMFSGSKFNTQLESWNG